MPRVRSVLAVLVAFLAATLVPAARAQAESGPALKEFLSPAYPFELVSAKKAERIAWIAYERGQRNVYTAVAPEFRPIRLTRFLGDDGVDLTGLSISDDGSVVVFVRGHTPNRQGWVANPTSDPNGAERAIWAARTAGGPAWRLAEGTDPVLSPDGRWVAFASDGQIYRLRVTQAAALSPIDKAEKPLIREWGTNGSPVWSPDGTKIAFFSNRVDHSFIGVYDVGRRAVTYLAPGVDRDSSPVWSPDSRRIAFIRRPGLPFGQQVQAGSDGMVENVALSTDGRTLYFCTNAGDIDRRHIWKVPTAGGEAVQLTRGDEIETYPVALASGTRIAVLSAGVRRPQSVGIVAAGGGATRIIFPALPRNFPLADHVVPQNVMTKAEDGLEIHNQLFLPKNLKSGERRPAVVFVHGGPGRQMLLGYHYRLFYHLAYGVNQWLANQGYIVISVNYRSGIGYGKSFRTAPKTGGRGNAEYQDVVAAARYLQSRPDVDAERIGIWGLSYGGLLTAQALARNSDIFKVGVDLAGVHLQGSSLDPESVSYQSSAISQIDQ